MKKAKAAAVILAAGCLLWGCKESGSPFPPDRSLIYVSGDGEIFGAQVETYDASLDYFSQEELEAMAKQEADAYNQTRWDEGLPEDETAASVEECSLSDGTARVVYRYRDGSELCRFTEEYQDTANHPDYFELTKTDQGWEIRVSGTVTVQTEGKILTCTGGNLTDAYTAEVSGGDAYLLFK